MGVPDDRHLVDGAADRVEEDIDAALAVVRDEYRVGVLDRTTGARDEC
jgi:hypothetical protein